MSVSTAPSEYQAMNLEQLLEELSGRTLQFTIELPNEDPITRTRKVCGANPQGEILLSEKVPFFAKLREYARQQWWVDTKIEIKDSPVLRALLEGKEQNLLLTLECLAKIEASDTRGVTHYVKVRIV